MQRILEMFQIDFQWEVLEMLVGGRDVFVIHPKGLGKYILRHHNPKMCEGGQNHNIAQQEKHQEKHFALTKG